MFSRFSRYFRCGLASAFLLGLSGCADNGKTEQCCDGKPHVKHPDSPSQPKATTKAQSQTSDGSVHVVSNNGTYEISFTTDPSPIPLNEIFSMNVTVSRRTGDGPASKISLAADAAMPAHQHGMNTRPRVTELGDDKFRVQGMQLHMPGYWEIYFDISSGALSERAQYNLELE